MGLNFLIPASLLSSKSTLFNWPKLNIFLTTVIFSGRSQDYFQSTRGERAQVVKHKDNLTLEGAHSMEKTQELAVRGERATIVRHEDNLKVGLGALWLPSRRNL